MRDASIDILWCKQAILNDIWKGKITGGGSSYSPYRQGKFTEVSTGNSFAITSILVTKQLHELFFPDERNMS